MIALAGAIVAHSWIAPAYGQVSFDFTPDQGTAFEHNSETRVSVEYIAKVSDPEPPYRLFYKENTFSNGQEVEITPEEGVFSFDVHAFSTGSGTFYFDLVWRDLSGNLLTFYVERYEYLVVPAATAITLTQDSPAASSNEPVSLTANVTQHVTESERGPIFPEGSVVFTVNGVPQAPVPVAFGGIAAFTTNDLVAGENTVTAEYLPSKNYISSQSEPLVLNIGGSLVLRQETSGPDATFGFSSETAELNVTLATTNGTGSTAIDLWPGSHTVTADDMSGAGFGLTGISCDPAAVVDLGGRSATFDIEDGETVTCTFSSVNSREETAQLIEDFLVTRAGLILSNQPDMQRRIDRLNGIAPATGSAFDTLTAYLPGVMSSGEAAISASLSQFDQLAGNQKPRDFDVWFEGTFALFGSSGTEGVFNAASIGTDYVVSRNLLIGAFAQLEHTAMSSTIDSATIGGTGWLIGPYATARLRENMYLDVLAGVGGSANIVSPYGTYEDSFGASRWLISAALQGEWQWDNVSFQPRARLAYFEETTDAYTDGLGVDIPSITAGVGQLALGPALSHRTVTDDGVVIDAGLRAEIVAGLLTAGGISGFDTLHGRIEASLDVAMPRGGSVALSVAQDGLGGDVGSTSAQGRVAVPIN
jgi:hypothetical protein